MSKTRQRVLKFDIQSWWHAGTGRGAGPGADALVYRSAEGLPVLPGRTVKGLVRAAMEQALRLGWLDQYKVDGAQLEHWLGTSLPSPGGGGSEQRVDRLEEVRFRTQAGVLRFDDAEIGKKEQDTRAWRAWAAHPDNAEDRRHLFHSIASTRIDAHGRADDKTLRTVEVAVPMVLYAPIEGPSSKPSWTKALRRSLPLLRGLGSGRNRGLGRVEAKLEKAR